MADPRIEAFKRFALQQAAQQAPPDAAPMGGGPPQFNPGAPQATPAPQVTAVQSQPGPIKSFLSQFLYGTGQGLLQHVGLPTDVDKQKIAFEQQQQAQTQQRLQQVAAAQVDALQGKTELAQAAQAPVDLSTLGIQGLTGTVPQRDVIKAITQHLKGGTAEAVANTRADATTAAAQTRADASTENAGIAAQVRRDVAAGQLGMAGARLRLAQQVAAAKQNGTFGSAPADRLRRGDLANNAQDNIARTVDDIKKNPDLFGKIQGRYTDVQQMIGSDDPAIARIGIQIHNAALASNGAHGLRSAQAIADTEKAMLNHFRNSPEATISGLDALSGSLDTFVHDATMGKTFVPRGTSPASSGAKATHRFNPATGKIEAIQ